MGKKILVFIVLLSAVHLLHAQGKPDRTMLDQETYQLYQEKNWKKLIVRGEYALEQGYDFYYLRMRLGLAWFSLGRFEKARTQFLIALKSIPHDRTASYYLYYANLYSGRSGEARKLLKLLPMEQIGNIKAPGKFSLSGISAEGGVFINNSVEDLKNGLPSGDKSNSYFTDNMNYINFTGGVNLGYSSGIVLSANRFSSNNLQYTYSRGNLMEFPQTSSQNGLYMKYLYNFPRSWYGGIAYHGIKGSYSYTELQTNQGGIIQFKTGMVDYQQKYAGGFIGKHFKYFDSRAQFSLNEFWHGPYLQTGGSLYYYPTGSIDYYLHAGYDRMFALDSVGNAEWAWKFAAGLKLYKGFYLIGSHVRGNLSNWADANGYYLFNTVYPIRSRSGVGFLISGFSSHLQINITGYFQNRDHYAEISQPDGSTSYIFQNYSTTSIFGGISWSF